MTSSRVLERSWLIALAIAALVASIGARGDTIVGGEIPTNTTWTLASSPYLVTSAVNVRSGSNPVLTIEAGVVVKFRPGTSLDIGYTIPGQLTALGTPTNPIRFTTDQATVTAGYWQGVFFSSGTGSQLSYVTIEGGGTNTTNAGLTVRGGSTTVDHATIQTSGSAGVRVSSGALTLTNSTITGTTLGDAVGLECQSGTVTMNSVALTGNSGAAIALTSGAVLSGLTAITASGNGLDGVRYRSNLIYNNETWKSFGLPYVLDTYVNVRSSSTTPVLTIEAGLVVKFKGGGLLDIGNTSPGQLIALGTSTQPIRFTTDQATVTAGYWQGLYFSSTAGSQLSYVTIEGGGTSALNSGLTVRGGSVTVDHATIQTSTNAGVRVSSGALTLTNSTITGTTSGDAVGLECQSGTVTMNSVALTGNFGAAIALTSGAVLSGLTGITATGNGLNGVRYRSNLIYNNETWKSFGLPYVLDTYVNVRSSSTTPVLTIEAGLVVRFKGGNSYLDIGNTSPGQLVALGTSTQPIRFTTDQATVTAGYWQGLYFSSSTGSQLSYVTIEGGGTSALNSGLTVRGGSVIVDHATIQTSANAGVRVSSGALTLTNSTITGTTSGDAVGLECQSGTVTMNSVALTGNAGAAIALTAGAVLSAVTAITATGNGLNGVRYRSNTIYANETWKSFGLPYVLDTYVNVRSSTTPVLTIEAGLVVQFKGGNSYLDIGNSIPGRLIALGTLTQPIRFTTDQATVTAGYWQGLYFSSGTGSQLSYVLVEGGGTNTLNSSLTVRGGSVTVDNATIQTSGNAGVRLFSGALTLTNSTITGTTLGDAVGLECQSGTVALDSVALTGNAGAAIALTAGAVLSAVTAITATNNGLDGVRYRSNAIGSNETWKSFGLPYVLDGNLGVSGGSNPLLTIEGGLTVKFRQGTYLDVGNGFPGRLLALGTLGKVIRITTDQTPLTPGYWQGLYFSSGTGSELNWTLVEGGGSAGAGVTIRGGSPLLNHAVIRTNLSVGVKVTAGAPTFVDCNIYANGTGLLNATYPQRLLKASLNYWGAVDGPNAGQGTGSGDAVSGLVLYEPFLVYPPSFVWITKADLTERKFNPALGHAATWLLGGSQSGGWTIKVFNSANTVIRTLTAPSGQSASLSWDGKNGTGVDQPDGTYTYAIDFFTPGRATAKGRVFVDRTLVYPVITAPVTSAILSNVYQNGVADYAIKGSLSSSSLAYWTLEYGSGTTPASWAELASGTSSVSNSTLATWATLPLSNGPYTLRLTMVDTICDVLLASTGVTVGNFKASRDVLQFSAAAGGAVNVTSTVPFPLTETIFIRTWSGTLVKTLLAALRPAGTYSDPWTASADPDGAYIYTIGLNDGAGHTMTWDQSSQFVNGYTGYNDSLQFSSYDPFNNKPLTFTFNFPLPGSVSLAFTPVVTGPDNCNPPAFCILNRTPMESGLHTIAWAGVDGTGAFRPDIRSAAIVIDQATFPVSGFIVYGRKPNLAAMTLAVQDLGPAVDVQTFSWLPPGTMNVCFNLTTNQSEPVTLKLTFLNQASLSVLRTITVPSQVFPFNVIVSWDGRADDGSLVAPGAYTITVTAIDALGNQGSAQLCAKVEY